MKSKSEDQNRTHPLRAAGTMVGGLGLAGAAFAAAAYWVGAPLQTPAEKEAATVAPPALASDPTPAAVTAARPEAPAPEPTPVSAPAKPAEKPSVQIGLESEDPSVDFLAEADAALEDGETAGALTALRHHVHHNPVTAEVLLRIGRLAREVGKDRVSVAALEEVRRMVPEDPEVHIQLVRSYLEVGRYTKARRTAERAVRLAPQEAISWNLLGRAEMARSNWEAAEMAFDRALTLEPANPHLYNNEGLLFVYMKRGADAIDAIETAIELFGDDVPHYVLNNLGLAFELEGRLEAARGAFEEAMALSPFYVKARVNLRRVDRALAARMEEAAQEVADGASPSAVVSAAAAPPAETSATSETP